MKYKAVLVLVVLFLVFCGFVFAGELTSKEAGNYFKAGVKAQKAANFAEADINYQKTLLVASNDSNYQKYILNNRGIMYTQIGDLDKADACFKAALQIDAKYNAAKLNLGLLNEKRLSRCEALEYWAKVYGWEKTKPRDFSLEEASGETKKEETK